MLADDLNHRLGRRHARSWGKGLETLSGEEPTRGSHCPAPKRRWSQIRMRQHHPPMPLPSICHMRLRRYSS